MLVERFLPEKHWRKRILGAGFSFRYFMQKAKMTVTRGKKRKVEMKCSEFKRLLEKQGCTVVDRSFHRIAYRKGFQPQPIPGFSGQEIHEGLRRFIMKRYGL